MAFSAGLNAASAGYSSSQTNSYGSANYSGSSNSSTDVYGSSSGYLGSFDTNTRSSGSIYGQSSSYTTNYDGLGLQQPTNTGNLVFVEILLSSPLSIDPPPVKYNPSL